MTIPRPNQCLTLLICLLISGAAGHAEPAPGTGALTGEPGRVERAAFGEAERSYSVAGLEAPAEIVVDAWGVPHIYANTHYDAFFVQGFNAARDRLWQMDLWRRRGLGLLSEVLGEGYVAQDRAARLFLYRGDMYREWLAYGDDAKRIAEAFTAGINAFVDQIEEHPSLMPPEFGLLGYEPSRWQPQDVVRIRSHGLTRNLTSEVKRAHIACRHGLEAASLWKVLEPQWTPRIPDGLDPCSIPERVADQYLLAKARVDLDPQALAARGAGNGGVEALLAEVRRRDLDGALGSNNWAVAPGRTATGRPILANDPHRSHAVPSLRYVAHLVAPGLNVIGGGEPVLPGISIGHNQRIAFGLTVFPIDQEDLYVYERAGEGYRYRGRVEPYQTITETVPVKGGEPRQIRLDYTRHGPVVFETQDKVFAVRAAWLEPGMAPYFGSVAYLRARNWREFTGALNRWGSPGENQVYADVDGNIGYQPAGMFPRRNDWDGLLPVPGNGRYEWDGYFDMDVLPREYNPERGFISTANSMNLPPDYPISQRRVGFEWSAPWRYRRLQEVLADQTAHTLEDSLNLQRDYLSVLARQVVALLPEQASGPAGEGLEMLRNWNHALTPDSPGALLFATWFYGHLRPALERALLTDEPDALEPLDTLTILDSLRYPLGRSIAVETLGIATLAARVEYGEPESWAWGDLHQIHFQHPLLERAPESLAEQMGLPSYPRGGSANTVNNTSFDADDYRVRSGASFRMVLDVGNWDAARMTNAPGQSGDPRSPFYGNLLKGWATDQSFPLLYSRDAVMANRALVIGLTPAP